MMQLLPILMSLLIMIVPVFGPGDWKDHTKITKIDDNLYTGRDADDDHIPELKKYGIKTIVSIRMNGQPGKAKKAHELGMNYFHFPVGFFHRPTKQVYHFLKVMDDPKYLPVYVSCSIGLDRSSGFVAVYKARLKGEDPQKAIASTRGWIFKKKLIALLDTWHDECMKGKMTKAELAAIDFPKEGPNANNYAKNPGEDVIFDHKVCETPDDKAKVSEKTSSPPAALSDKSETEKVEPGVKNEASVKTEVHVKSEAPESKPFAKVVENKRL
jgi:protein tyrosine phosphatase (PTP) superfamily phosphohydrolase (DUF442 family)